MTLSPSSASFESESSIETYGELQNDDSEEACEPSESKVSLLDILLVETQRESGGTLRDDAHDNLEIEGANELNRSPISKKAHRRRVLFSSCRGTSWRSHNSSSLSDTGSFSGIDDGYEEEMKRIEEFINNHHASRMDLGQDNDAVRSVAVNDYQNFVTANAASPNAIYATTTYCLQTNDVSLLDVLLRDIGIEYILRHCYYMSGSFLDDEADQNNSDFNMFWVCSYFGSAEVLKLLAEECLAWFSVKNRESRMNHSGIGDSKDADDSDAMEKAKNALVTIMDKPTQKWDSTPLYIAVVQNHPEVISVLLEYGVDANRMNKEGNTPAIIAASLNNTEALVALASSEESNRVDFNLANNKAMNPLLTAAIQGNVDILKFFHQYKCNDVNPIDFKCKDANGFGCVSLAAKYNHHEAITFFCKIQNPTSCNGVDINQRHSNDEETALHIAARHNRPQVVRAFFEHNPCHCNPLSKNKYTMTALHIAASLNHPSVCMEICKRLSRDTLDLLDCRDDLGYTPLFYACAKGFLDVVKLLAPIAKLNRTCRIQYMKKNKAKDLGEGKSTNKVAVKASQYKVQPPLVIASIKGHLDICSVLLACGAEVDQTDETGHTSLLHASKNGHAQVVMELIHGGADPRAKSKKGFRTPLQKAKKYKHHDIVKFLEANGG